MGGQTVPMSFWNRPLLAATPSFLCFLCFVLHAG